MTVPGHIELARIRFIGKVGEREPAFGRAVLHGLEGLATNRANDRESVVPVPGLNDSLEFDPEAPEVAAATANGQPYLLGWGSAGLT